MIGNKINLIKKNSAPLNSHKQTRAPRTVITDGRRRNKVIEEVVARLNTPTFHINEQEVREHTGLEGAQGFLHVEEGGPAPSGQVQGVHESQGRILLVFPDDEKMRF